MDDPHRKPGDRDRSALVARIRRAADEGRIAPVDRDIRIANVGSAQSMADLDLIARDLDQLDAAVPAGAAAPTAWARPSQAPLADQITDQAVTAARTTVRSIGVTTLVLLLLVALGVGTSAVVRSRGSDTPRHDRLFSPQPIPSDLTTDPTDVDPTTQTTATGSAYALTGPGIRWFVREYRHRLSTSMVVDLTLYDDYAVVQAPQGGAHRHLGLLYRRADGWQDFGGVSADFPGSKPVDLRRLDVGALVRNIARARRGLGVDAVSQTYVVIDYRPEFDPSPNVDIHVANAYGESGYLATTLDGSVERAYPYDAS